MKKVTITLKLSEIITNSKNEKIHTKDNMALIRASMEEIGYITPIVVDEDNTILAGHGRYFVMQEDGKKKVEVIKVTGLSKLQKDKFRIYDNQSSRTGKYDEELLLGTIEGILEKDGEFNISILGIDGLAESFSDTVLQFDLGNAALSEKTTKNKAIFILPEEANVSEVRDLLDTNNIKYHVGNVKENK